jgi:hypothetical protein
MKVWLCSDGSYSDYSVTAIYSDEATARLVTAAYGWDNEPEEMDLDPEIPQEVRDGLSAYGVLMWENGDVHRVSKEEDDWYKEGRWIDNYRDWDNPPRTGRLFGMNCWARDEQHAIKIANERRIMSLALPERRSAEDT